jgi:DNA invertase Pin-like site-specific DNA recombinase
MTRKTRAAAYPRVSDEHLKDSQTLADQAKSIRAYCEQQGYELLESHIYPEAETAYNKPFREREQLMKMLDDLPNTLTKANKDRTLMKYEEHFF